MDFSTNVNINTEILLIILNSRYKMTTQKEYKLQIHLYYTR